MNLFTRRRLTFQLTPLLDLLLIVIFAQYMEVRATTGEELAEARETAERYQTLEAEHDAALIRTERFEQQNEALRATLQDEAERTTRLANRFAEIFEVQADVLAEALDPENPRVEGISAEDRERLRRQLGELVSAKGPEALEHLVTYEELRKRADLWRVRIGNVADGGRVTVDAGGRTDTFAVRSAEGFATRLATIRNDVEQPKGLVILLLTYDSTRADFLTRNAVRGGLSRFVTRTQGNETTRFFWAEIGFDPALFEEPK
jgi:hypothetical protein